MLSLLRGHVSDAAAPFIFVILFLIIVGAALWITPRLANWLDKKDAENKSYYDGMLTEDPNAPKEEKDDGEAD
ncbi:MAG: hypothetical protein HDT20_03650 [Oscillibacter sp.]|nr:hypothetical protein [Oscillibacter sp.]